MGFGAVSESILVYSHIPLIIVRGTYHPLTPASCDSSIL
jgi:hypothetical protein